VPAGRLLGSGILHRVVWYKFTEVSDKNTASVIKVYECAKKKSKIYLRAGKGFWTAARAKQ
jgi:hypothetical protein